MMKNMLVPKERLAVVIGKDGSVRKTIQKKTNTTISINDDVSISGEPLGVIAAERIILAIGRGFSPENAFELLDDESRLEIIELPKNRKILNRTRSRLIGTDGKIRKKIEYYTDTHISIYGKTVSIIGKNDAVMLCRETLEKIISGSEYKSVFTFLVNKNDKEH